MTILGMRNVWRPRVTQAIEKHALYVASSPKAEHLCMTTTPDTVELWNTSTDALVTKQAVGKVGQLFAHSAGCVVRVGDKVVLVPLDGKPQSIALDTDVRALGVMKNDLLIAGEKHVSVVQLDGVKKDQCLAVKGITALSAVGSSLAVGTDVGQVSLLDCAGNDSTLKNTFFDNTPSSTVERITAGPRGTVAVGFANGLVGLWSTDDGSLLTSANLHGSINHLLVKDRELFAASELGDSRSWDLTSLMQNDCELVRHAWKEVPVGWENGRPVVKGIPSAHRCADSQ